CVSLSRTSFEGTLQLIEVVVVVPGHNRNKLIDCDPSVTAYPGALPLEVHFRLVVFHDGVEADKEHLLTVPPVGAALPRSPVLWVRTARQDGVTPVVNRRGQLVRRARHTCEPCLKRLLRIFLDGCHLAPPPKSPASRSASPLAPHLASNALAGFSVSFHRPDPPLRPPQQFM